MKFLADEIATPDPQNFLKVRRYHPGLIEVDTSGRIRSVSSFSRAKLKLASARSFKRMRCVIPGLVDPHTHLLFGGDRAAEWGQRLAGATYQSIAKAGGGIRHSVEETRKLSVAALVELGKKRLQTAAAFGVTTLEAKSGYGLSLESELRLLTAAKQLQKNPYIDLVSTFMGAHSLPPEFSETSDYVDYLIAKVLPRVKGLARFQDAFCEAGYFSAKDSIRLLAAGKKYGLLPKVHAHEFGRTGGVEVASQVNAVSADHLMVVNAADLKKLRTANVVPVVLPGTSFFLGAKKFAPARAMLDQKLPVALATDYNPGTNPTQNFPLIGTLAAVHLQMTLEEILCAQTLHGAMALALNDRGVIAKNYRADFVEFDVEHFEQIYYHYGSLQVKASYKRGQERHPQQ